MKNIWKKLSAGLLAFALVFTTIPPVTVSADTADTGTDTSQNEQIIDVSTSNSFTLPNGGDVTYVLTGTNTAAEVYIGGDCDIILRDVTLKRIYTNYADTLTVNITLDGENVIHQDKSASQGALEVRRSQVTINGGEDDSLHAKSRAFPAYSNSDEVEAGGGLTINGGNITFELTEKSGGAPIQTAYTQNGGTVKVIGTTNYCFHYKVYMNGGSLEAEHHSSYEGYLAFNNYVYMKNGASIKVSSSERPIGGAGRFKLGEGSAANDCLFIRFDESSEFVYFDTDDEENDVLSDKNYAEIKVMEHDHDFEGNSCACGFVCRHDTDNGNCGVCGTYIYNISHQPTEAEPYVTLNDGTCASYQWYQMKNISEIIDKSKTYPLSTFDPEYFTESSTFDAAIGWIPADYSEEGYEYKNLLYVAAPYKEGDKVTIYFSSPVEYAELFGSGENYVVCEFDGNKATAVIPADGVYAVHASTEDTEPTARVYVGDGERSALAGQTGATLSQYTYGDYYFCEATAKDGTVLTSALADFTYKITHQPTDREQYVSLNSSMGAAYQWYVERGGIVQVTDEHNLGFSVLGAPPEIGGTYDSENGWSPDEYGYYFTVWLDEGVIMNLEFSQTPEECYYLFSATEGTMENDVTIEGTTLTAPASGYYGVGAAGGGYLKATFDGTEYVAVNGQTEATLNAGELGRYRCEVTFANGKKETSDTVEVLHLHTGGTATCKDQAVCSSCGIGYGPLSKEHKYDNACDTECNVCKATRSITHDFKDADCETAKTCKICSATEGEALGHDWIDADCETAKTCKVCSKTEGAALGHDWKAATCETAKTCKVCSKTEGEALGHEWIDADCETPMTCKTCGATKGTALDHDWAEPDCDTPMTCKICGTTEGEALGHDWADADCYTAKKCRICAATEGEALGHDWVAASCETAKKCTVCGKTEGEALGHDWKAADCETAKTCKVCSKTEGEALGHDWKAATCDTAKTCKTCGKTEGEALGHDWKAATCDTAKTCKTCGKTEGAALGHDWKAATCDTAKTCKTCGKTEGAALGHSAGTAEVTKQATTSKNGELQTKCRNCGKVLSRNSINKASKVSLSKASYTYNGKTKSPKVVVKDSKGNTISSKYYTVSKPSGRKAIGKYTYTVKFKGNYTGTKKLTLTIKPVKPTIQTPKAAKKAITVKWKKGKKAQVTGYEVIVATNNKFTKGKKTATVKGYSKVSKKVTGLKAKTKYYVKVRTYKTVKGVKIYSDWSKVKTIKTK